MIALAFYAFVSKVSKVYLYIYSYIYCAKFAKLEISFALYIEIVYRDRQRVNELETVEVARDRALPLIREAGNVYVQYVLVLRNCTIVDQDSKNERTKGNYR